MKLLHLFLLSYCSLGIVFGQYEHYDLNQNNVNLTVSNSGVFFRNSDFGTNGYEIPSGSGKHAFYTMGFWFGGEDVSGQLKMAIQAYVPGGDVFQGPLTNDGTATWPASSEDYTIYPVSKSMIDYHIDNVGEAGYIVPDELLNWPAHGDIDAGVDYYLAPFVDVNGNGIYDPTLGDYPKIKGDKAVYIILNDKGGIHASGADPIGIEIHYLFYQYSTADYLNNTSFVNVKVINRGTQTLYNFRTGCFADTDLGADSDDYVGFNIPNNMMYAYTSDNFDGEDVPGSPGYGANPPAFGITLLNHNANAFATFHGVGVMGAPTTPAEYYSYMGAIWPDGTHFTEGGSGYGGADETNFLYSGNPGVDGDWSELGEGNIGGDRRMVMSAEDEAFEPHEILCFDYAIIYNRDGDHLENVDGLIDLAGEVKGFYDNDINPYCETGFSGISEQDETLPVGIIPNPSKGTFSVDLKGTFDIQIFALDGRLVYSQSELQGAKQLQTDLSNGTYIIMITQNQKKYQSKLVIN